MDKIEDETIVERLIGLTEMFPDSLVNFVSKSTELAVFGTKKLYGFGSSALWIASTSFTILALPLIFEVERAQAEEAEKQQQRQVNNGISILSILYLLYFIPLVFYIYGFTCQ